MRGPTDRQAGFTLIELITVVVVLALMAVMGTGFIVSATESYRTTQTRAALVNTGRQALERMTRQLRGTLPYSVRVTNGGNCVEFMSVAGGGFYRDAVPDEANGAPAHTHIDTTPHQVDFGSAEYLSIGAMDSDELYGGSAGSLAAINGRTGARVDFASRTWLRNSLSQRFYLLNAPGAFCLFGGQLRFYPEQDVTAGNVDASSGYDLLARNARVSGTLFALSQASEDRNVILAINMGFTEGGETITFAQEVLIRNVP